MIDEVDDSCPAQWLISQWRKGRPIVPFIGCGLSVGSGFPITSELREYLAKVEYFIRFGVYRRLQGGEVTSPQGTSPASCEQNLSQYLVHYGWPDYNRINADLWSYAERPLLFERDLERSAEKEWSVSRTTKDAITNETLSRCSLKDKKKLYYILRCMEESKNRFLETLAEDPSNVKIPWGQRGFRLRSMAQLILLDIIRYEDASRAKVLEEQVWKHELDIRLDWFRLLLNLTEGRLGLIDSLFAQLSRNRSPSLGHRLIAHLSRSMGWQTILTLNHDDLLDKAFFEEGLSPKSFDISRDASVPDATLVRREPLSLVKLHGSTHGLRVGESTNHALDEHTKAQVLDYMPQDALLLVLGFSGYEKRMMSLIEAVGLRRINSGRPAPAILWMHKEPKQFLPEPLMKLQNRLGKSVNQVWLKTAPLFDAGGFLLGLFQRLTSALPRTKTSYPSLPKQNLSEGIREGSSSPSVRVGHYELSVKKLIWETKNSQGPLLDPEDYQVAIHLFIDRELVKEGGTFTWKEWHKSKKKLDSSILLSQFVQSQKLNSYQKIWIDLEDHHTVTGVVTEVISQLRVFDPTLPPLMLPVSGGQLQMEKFYRAVRYIHRALRRGRYVLAFDSFEGFSRPQTMHHGLPQFNSTQSQFSSTQSQEEIIRRVDELIQFLQLLLHVNRRAYPSDHPNPLDYDWYCALAFDTPQMRHFSIPKERIPIDKAIDLRAAKFVGETIEHTDRESEATRRCQAYAVLPAELETKLNKGERLCKWLDDWRATVEHEQYFDSIRNKENVQQEISKFINKVKLEALADEQAEQSFDSNDHGDMLVLMMSIFRRPRSRAAIAWMAKWLWNTDKEIDLQKVIDASGLLEPNEMEYYAIDDQTHQTAYKMLSRPAWLSQLKKLNEDRLKSGKIDLEGLLSRMAFLGTAHSSAARFYYTHAWERSHDVRTLFEYFYHRYASLKYLLMLELFLRRTRLTGNISITKATISSVQLWIGADTKSSLLDSLEVENPADIPAKFIDSVDKPVGTVRELIDRVQSLREEYLQVFINILRREENTMRAVAPAETWDGWIDTILDNLPKEIVFEDFRDWKYYKGAYCLNATSPKSGSTTWAHAFSLTSFARNKPYSVLLLARQLRMRLLRLKASLKRERGAYGDCLAERHKLTSFVRPDSPRKPSNIDTKKFFDGLSRGFGGPFSIQKWNKFCLDISQNPNKYGLESKSDLLQLITETLIDVISIGRYTFKPKPDNMTLEIRTFYKSQTDAAKKWLSFFKDSAEPSNLLAFFHTIEFEVLRLRSEYLKPWGSISRAQKYDGDKTDNKPDKEAAESLLEDIKKLLETIYRIPFDAERSFVMRRAHLKSLQGRVFVCLKKFDEALRALDEAQNSLAFEGADELFFQAIVHRYTVEALQLYANHLVSPPNPSTNNFLGYEAQENMTHAATLLRLAATELESEETVLRSARRNIRAWKRLYRGQAQQAIEELLLMSLQAQLSPRAWPDPSHFVVDAQRIILKGLEGIRGGMDCILYPDANGKVETPDGQHVKDECYGFLRQWISLFVASRANNLIVHKAIEKMNQFGEKQPTSPQEKFADAIQSDSRTFVELWRELNRSAGLERWVQALDYNREVNTGDEKTYLLDDLIYACDHRIAYEREQYPNISARQQILNVIVSMFKVLNSREIEKILRKILREEDSKTV